MAAIVLLVIRILIAAGLYLFLGLILYTLWQEIKQQSLALSPAQIPGIILFIELSGERMAFHKYDILIGRDPTCDVCLLDQTVSGQHAKITHRQGQWWVEDLHSTNGTFLNELMVTQPVVITIGDRIRLGQVTVRVEG